VDQPALVDHLRLQRPIQRWNLTVLSQTKSFFLLLLLYYLLSRIKGST
jgi:hypothetical protein